MATSDPQPVAPPRRLRWYRYGLWSLAALALLGVLASITIVPQIKSSRDRKLGWEQAGVDWNEHKAVLLGISLEDYGEAGPYRFSYNYDPETGLFFRPWHIPRTAFQDGYVARVQDLIKSQGIPTWGVKDHHVSRERLLSALKRSDFREVRTFPFDVTPNIVIFKRGSINRWGGTMSSTNDGLHVATPQLLLGYGQPAKHIYVGRLNECPGVWFIRSDAEFVGAHLEDGRYLCSATLNK